MQKLSADEVTEHTNKLAGWKLHTNRIEATFLARDFAEAFSFMTHIAFKAEKMNHHPDWSNTYGDVTIRLTSHEVQGVTMQDIELAVYISTVARHLGLRIDA